MNIRRFNHQDFAAGRFLSSAICMAAIVGSCFGPLNEAFAESPVPAKSMGGQWVLHTPPTFGGSKIISLTQTPETGDPNGLFFDNFRVKGMWGFLPVTGYFHGGNFVLVSMLRASSGGRNGWLIVGRAETLNPNGIADRRATLSGTVSKMSYVGGGAPQPLPASQWPSSAFNAARQ